MEHVYSISSTCRYSRVWRSAMANARAICTRRVETMLDINRAQSAESS